MKMVLWKKVRMGREGGVFFERGEEEWDKDGIKGDGDGLVENGGDGGRWKMGGGSGKNGG